MVIFKIVPFACSCLLVVLVLCGPVVSGDEDDCVYKKCEWKFRSKPSGHYPCWSQSRRLVRSFDCADNNTYHICCDQTKVSTKSIGESRLQFFKSVSNIGEMLSPACTKRILCEQICWNHDFSSSSSFYNLQTFDENTTETRKEYVRSYGDDLECHRRQHSQNISNSTLFNQKVCLKDCAKKYSNCQRVLDIDFTVKCYFASARLFHKLGLWFFSAFNMTFDSFGSEDLDKSVHQSIKSSFTVLYHRMETLESAYYDWFDREVFRKRRSIELELEKTWKQFLVIFNGTDPALAHNLYESLNRTQFSDAISVINHTLVTTDFGSIRTNNVLRTPCQGLRDPTSG